MDCEACRKVIIYRLFRHLARGAFAMGRLLVGFGLIGALSQAVLAHAHTTRVQKVTVLAPEDRALSAQCHLFLVRPDLRTPVLRSFVEKTLRERKAKWASLRSDANAKRMQIETEAACSNVLRQITAPATSPFLYWKQPDAPFSLSTPSSQETSNQPAHSGPSEREIDKRIYGGSTVIVRPQEPTVALTSTDIQSQASSSPSSPSSAVQERALLQTEAKDYSISRDVLTLPSVKGAASVATSVVVPVPAPGPIPNDESNEPRKVRTVKVVSEPRLVGVAEPHVVRTAAMRDEGNTPVANPAPQIEPWPPPIPTDQAIFTIDPATIKTVGNFADALTKRLNRAGIYHLRFWGAPDGIAVVAPLEAIDSEGHPLRMEPESLEARSDTGGPLTAIIQGFRKLLSAPIRDSRILLFILTDDSNAKNPAVPMSPSIARDWTQNGYMRPDINRDLPLTASHFVVVNVYEFHKEKIGDPELLTEEHKLHSVLEHLAASDLEWNGFLK
jgi:hypothetical protein